MQFVNFYCGLRFSKTNHAVSKDDICISLSEPWDCFKNPFLRFLCHLHLSSKINSIIRMPFRTFWTKRIVSKIITNKSEPVCFIINSHFITFAQVLVKNRSINKRLSLFVVLELPDKYDHFSKIYRSFPAPSSLIDTFSLVISYNFNDSYKFGFVQSRPCFGDFSMIQSDERFEESDLFFVGKNKGRIEEIHRIYNLCVSNGLKCLFFVTDVKNEDMIYKGISYNNPIPYESVLKYVKKTHCVLNISQDGGEGYTLRDYEALGNNKYLLTNNYMLKNSPLYSSDQIIFIDELHEKLNLIKKGFSGNNNLSTEYGRRQWFDWLESLLENENHE